MQRAFPDFTLLGHRRGYLQPDAHLHQLQIPLRMGMGGLFDHFPGDFVRAPVLIRRLGQEWLNLMLLQFHEFRRYTLGNPLFLLRIVRSKLLGSDAVMQ